MSTDASYAGSGLAAQRGTLFVPALGARSLLCRHHVEPQEFVLLVERGDDVVEERLATMRVIARLAGTATEGRTVLDLTSGRTEGIPTGHGGGSCFSCGQVVDKGHESVLMLDQVEFDAINGKVAVPPRVTRPDLHVAREVDLFFTDLPIRGEFLPNALALLGIEGIKYFPELDAVLPRYADESTFAVAPQWKAGGWINEIVPPRVITILKVAGEMGSYSSFNECVPGHVPFECGVPACTMVQGPLVEEPHGEVLHHGRPFTLLVGSVVVTNLVRRARDHRRDLVHLDGDFS